MINDLNKPVWQWPYSAFGTTKPTGVLKATAKPKNAMTNQPVLLKGTVPAQVLNLRDPGQYEDPETGLRDNINRMYSQDRGRYIQMDPIGMRGGWSRVIYSENSPLTKTDPMGLQAIVPTPFGPMPIPPLVPANINYPPPDFDPWRDTQSEVRTPVLDPRVPNGPKPPNDPNGNGACRRMYESCMKAATHQMCPAVLKPPAIALCTAALISCIATLGD